MKPFAKPRNAASSPFVDDANAYYTPLPASPILPPLPPLTALEQMFGYYSAD